MKLTLIARAEKDNGLTTEQSIVITCADNMSGELLIKVRASMHAALIAGAQAYTEEMR